MKYLLTLIIFLPLFSFSQKNLNLTDSGELLEKGIRQYDRDEYYEAIQTFSKIGINDTNYANAQYEMALSYVGMEQYVRAQEILHDLLDYKIRFSFKHQVYLLLGNAYDMNKQSDEAIEIYTEGLKMYPYQHNLLYNRGITYEGQKKYDLAFRDYKAALQGNMYHTNSHMKLGMLAANQGLYAQAMMSLMTFLYLSPDDNRSPAVVATIEKLANGTFERESQDFNMFEGEEDPYAKINGEFEEKLALAPAYKTKFTIPTDFAKQMHYILSKTKYEKDNYEFFNQQYMPFLESIWMNQKIDLFCLFSMVNVDNDVVQKKIKSKIKKIIAFNEWAGKEYNTKISTQYMEFEGEKQFIHVEYNRRFMEGFGKLGKDNSTPVGNHYYFHPNGAPKIHAHFDNEGKKIGTWDVFNEFDGSIERRVEFLDNDEEKIMFEYYFTGELYQKYKIVKGLEQDTVWRYYRNGTRREIFVLKDGKKNGVYREYYPNGALEYEMYFSNGVANGKYISYHPNGEKDNEFTITNDLIQGERLAYYPNKKMRSKYNYVDGLWDGPFERYFSDGQLEEKGAYKKGKQVGTSEEYYSNGAISSSITLDETGKQNGKSTFFDLDGKKYEELTFVKGDLTTITYYDKTGKASEIATKKGKKMTYIRSYPNGNKNTEGQYVDGLSEGTWTYFDIYGNKSKIEIYQNGILTDSITRYYSNGQIESVAKVEFGELNGMYLEYDKYGMLVQEGSYANGELNNEWFNYYVDGSLKSESYYVNGTRHGIQTSYSVNGKIESLEEYDMGRVISHIFIDTNENIMDQFKEYNGTIELHSPTKSYVRLKAEYKNGNADGTFNWYGPNNIPESKGTYVNDQRTGAWKWYDVNGKLAHETSYINDLKDGKELSYFSDGKVSSELTNVNGVAQGKYTFYYPSGKVSSTGTYLDDERHGKVMYYSPTGGVMLIRNYNYGKLESYSYLDANGKEVAPIELDDKELTVVTYYPNGKKANEHFRKNGLIEGQYRTYHENGQKWEEEYYENGEENGTFVEYNDAGVKIKEINYLKGEEHGKTIEYYANGKIKMEIMYKLGKKDGKCVEYSPDGKVLRTIIYYNDETLTIQ